MTGHSSLVPLDNTIYPDVLFNHQAVLGRSLSLGGPLQTISTKISPTTT
jgi:hypothetical protein